MVVPNAGALPIPMESLSEALNSPYLHARLWASRWTRGLGVDYDVSVSRPIAMFSSWRTRAFVLGWGYCAVKINLRGYSQVGVDEGGKGWWATRMLTDYCPENNFCIVWKILLVPSLSKVFEQLLKQTPSLVPRSPPFQFSLQTLARERGITLLPREPTSCRLHRSLAFENCTYTYPEIYLPSK